MTVIRRYRLIRRHHGDSEDQQGNVARDSDVVSHAPDIDPGEDFLIVALWLAYHPDWSEFAVFTNELDAHRYASPRTMSVEMIFTGKPVREQISNIYARNA